LFINQHVSEFVTETGAGGVEPKLDPRGLEVSTVEYILKASSSMSKVTKILRVLQVPSFSRQVLQRTKRSK